ncbi:ZIP family metal transporter [Anaerotalea alkaliphila]|uniref:ZIP family metal transporter n=1 Tax=Anaerotalea alkaliphila TaxID=2662126 RepID=A0A7X5KM48_9FIRM|nr:ZIP family metal transporter [Anaerotalea alkaliphila]NDL66584.1 ZIP family metal transporter [Anaerotalea alkaliphila]
MESLIYSFFAGTSTALGAIFLMFFGSPGKKAMAGLLGFAGGIMIAVSVFELMPSSLELGSMLVLVVGFLLGCLLMLLLDKFMPHAHLSESSHLDLENVDPKILETRTALRTGYLIFLGIALHNLPEGLAIGAGLEASQELGIVIALAIGLHNIPEGLAVAGPLKAGGTSNLRLFLFTLAAGLMTPIGTAIGLLVFSVSTTLIGGSLAFAAGAMMYIVNDELIPQSNKMHSHMANAGLIGGLLIGFVMIG